MKIVAGILLSLALAGVAQAAIYKHVDKNGHVTYSNMPMKGAVPIKLDPPIESSTPQGAPPSVPDGPKKAVPSPSSFPKVDKAEQQKRDDKRRQILEQELAAEREALGKARLAYAEAEKDPETFKTTVVGKDGKPQTVTRRNVARFQEKMRLLQEQIDLHEQNIGLLEKEIAQLK